MHLCWLQWISFIYLFFICAPRAEKQNWTVKKNGGGGGGGGGESRGLIWSNKDEAL